MGFKRMNGSSPARSNSQQQITNFWKKQNQCSTPIRMLPASAAEREEDQEKSKATSSPQDRSSSDSSATNRIANLQSNSAESSHSSNGGSLQPVNTSSLVEFPPLASCPAAQVSTPGKPIQQMTLKAIESSPENTHRITPAVTTEKGRVSHTTDFF